MQFIATARDYHILLTCSHSPSWRESYPRAGQTADKRCVHAAVKGALTGCPTYGPRTRFFTHNLVHDAVCLVRWQGITSYVFRAAEPPFSLNSAAARLCPCFESRNFPPNICVRANEIPNPHLRYSTPTDFLLTFRFLLVPFTSSRQWEPKVP